MACCLQHARGLRTTLEGEEPVEARDADVVIVGVPVTIVTIVRIGRFLSACRLRPFGSPIMKRTLWLVVIALVLPSCFEHAPRDPAQVRRSEYRAKKAKEREQRQRDRAERVRQQRAS